MTTIHYWPASELRLTQNQAEFLISGISRSWSPAMAARTEDSLSRRRMLAWVLTPSGHGALRPSPKGRAALAKYNGGQFVAANDNQREGADAA